MCTYVFFSVLYLLIHIIQGRCMALIQAASDVQEQGAVDDRDTFLHGVRDLLSIHSSKDLYFSQPISFLYEEVMLTIHTVSADAQASLSTYVSAPGIAQQISGLHSDLMILQSDLEHALPEDRNRCINELYVILFCCTSLLVFQ